MVVVPTTRSKRWKYAQKQIGRTRARDDMKLIRSCLFSLEKTLEARPRFKPSGFFVNCCVCGSRQKDVLDGVWDLARLAKDVRM